MRNKAKRARTMGMDAGDAHIGATSTDGLTTKITEFDVTRSNDEKGHPSPISHLHEVHDFNLGTMNMSRLDNVAPGSDGNALREGTFGGLEIEEAKTSKLMEMVVSLAKAL
ncbi:uncharacterized protein [Arachis hypogaea]|uniref:uncharacterized protein n=1 Tax=Arachis hypogaea TaxID=3818 RepID=UPI003B20C5F0